MDFKDYIVLLREAWFGKSQNLGEIIRQGEPFLSNDRFAARINAYKTLQHFRETGTIVPLSVTPLHATIEINEVVSKLAEVEVGRALAETYADRWPGSHKLQTHAVMLKGETAGGGTFRDDETQDIQVARHPNAKATLLVFCGVIQFPAD